MNALAKANVEVNNALVKKIHFAPEVANFLEWHDFFKDPYNYYKATNWGKIARTQVFESFYILPLVAFVPEEDHYVLPLDGYFLKEDIVDSKF